GGLRIAGLLRCRERLVQKTGVLRVRRFVELARRLNEATEGIFPCLARPLLAPAPGSDAGGLPVGIVSRLHFAALPVNAALRGQDADEIAMVRRQHFKSGTQSFFQQLQRTASIALLLRNLRQREERGDA